MALSQARIGLRKAVGEIKIEEENKPNYGTSIALEYSICTFESKKTKYMNKNRASYQQILRADNQAKLCTENEILETIDV